MDIQALQYPIGKYKPIREISFDQIMDWVSVIKDLPNQVEELVESLSYEGLDWRYRPAGWSIKQVVHHLADSHMNSFIRFKLAMTEESPTIRPYMEAKWAEMSDANNPEISSSLAILKGLHTRMVTLFEHMEAQDWDRTFYHPEYKKQLRLKWMLGLYAWHSNHHLAHIRQAVAREGDFSSETD